MSSYIAPGNVQFNYAELEYIWGQAGGSPQAAAIAAAIAMAESGGNSTATDLDSNGSIDRGLWQINSVHGSQSTYDIMGNARAAVSISGNGTNWGPWTTYSSGAYRQFLQGNVPPSPASVNATNASANQAVLADFNGDSNNWSQRLYCDAFPATCQAIQWTSDPFIWFNRMLTGNQPTASQQPGGTTTTPGTIPNTPSNRSGSGGSPVPTYPNRGTAGSGVVPIDYVTGSSAVGASAPATTTGAYGIPGLPSALDPNQFIANLMSGLMLSILQPVINLTAGVAGVAAGGLMVGFGVITMIRQSQAGRSATNLAGEAAVGALAPETTAVTEYEGGNKAGITRVAQTRRPAGRVGRIQYRPAKVSTRVTRPPKQALRDEANGYANRAGGAEAA